MNDSKLSTADATAIQLDDWGPIATALDGEPVTRGKILWKTDDDSVSLGVWEVSPGRVLVDFATRGETIHVLAGNMVCLQEHGTKMTVSAGDTMVFPRGWRGERRVEETRQKIYMGFIGAS